MPFPTLPKLLTRSEETQPTALTKALSQLPEIPKPLLTASEPSVDPTPVFTESVFPHAVEFELKENPLSITGDTMKITRMDTGEELYKLKSSVVSIRECKTLLAADGTPLLQMQETFFSLRDRMQINNPDTGEVLYTLRKKLFIPYIGSGTIQIWKGEKTEGDPFLEIKGNLMKKDFVVYDVESGESIGKVKRKFLNISKILLDKDSYVLTVEPYCNATLLVMLTVVLDEQYSD